ncbi:hypothetical protein GKZ68_10335 [Hymenobacter sp. BRD128]|uniref:hypothetical protein n=1 Tax=Hymenobacter sp. BRD128 TaxID=2675878 RepID=UPI001565672D|nr:hypothetical protein [Hymenobacter sp. BRD128]QKG56987.1 hypothetical protein GKZ68_10335 [Hymenobacter sp. BRD128]
MKKDTRDFLKQMADDTDAKLALEQQRPAVIEKAMEKAMKDYSLLGNYLKQLVEEFNDDPDAKRSKITLRFEGPLFYQERNYFTIRQLIDERAVPYPKGQLLLLLAPVYNNFDDLRLHVQTWQNNLNLEALRGNLSNYSLDEKPKQLTNESYKLAVVDSTYGWILDSTKPSQPLSTKELFFDFVHKLIMSNARA